MMPSNAGSRLWVLFGAAFALLVAARPAFAQDDPPTPESKFMDAGDLRLHYLDFGGEGLPLVLIHSEAWDAHTFEDFGPRFTARNRVLAVTRPGYGQSEGAAYDVPSQGEALIDFLDALTIDRAVFEWLVTGCRSAVRGYLQDDVGNERFHLYAVSPNDESEDRTGVPAARAFTPIDGIRARIYAMPEGTPPGHDVRGDPARDGGLPGNPAGAAG